MHRLTINSARFKSLTGTDKRFKYPERSLDSVRVQLHGARRSPALSATHTPPRMAKGSQPGVPRDATHLQIRCCFSIVRDSFFPKINFTEFHFCFILKGSLLLTLPRAVTTLVAVH